MAPPDLTNDPLFGVLGAEIDHFANHVQRLVRATLQHREVLQRASRWTAGVAPLDRSPASAAEAMRTIDAFARRHREDRHTLFGAYFAHHHLRSQAKLSRDLQKRMPRLGAAARTQFCNRIHERARAERREWVSALLECCINASAPGLDVNDYVIFNVGALTDHEDVDLALVAKDERVRATLSRAFAKLSKTFLRFASKIQLFLSEHMTVGSAGGVIDEYEELVKEKRTSVVIVMQLLGAEYLIGSRRLARRFRQRVTSRFFAGRGHDLAHEAFLRSVMAELRHHGETHTICERVAPKREIYLPSKLIIAASRVIHGVEMANPADALRALTLRNPERGQGYQTLRGAFVENEVLRSLFFTYVLKTDEVDIHDPMTLETCRSVAARLGLGATARRTAEERLRAYYNDVRARALGAVTVLTADVKAHLTEVSSFRKIFERGRELTGTDANLAIRLLTALQRHESGVFWDEVVDLIRDNDEMVSRFSEDLAKLPHKEQVDITEGLVAMMTDDATALIELLVFFAGHERERVNRSGGVSVAGLFWRAMIEVLGRDAAHRDRFVAHLDDDTESEALFRLASAYPPKQLARLADLLEAHDGSTRGERVARNLRSVLILVHHHSNRLGRVGKRVLGRLPEFIHRVSDKESVRTLARELMGLAAREPVPDLQIELLGDAFEVEVLGASLFAILEGLPAQHDEDYVRAFDLYVRELMKAYFRSVQDGSPVFDGFIPGRDFALYATGGLGRSEGFGADWDYLAVVPDDDRRRKKFFGKVIQRLAAAMTRRGVIPHNRFSHTFNSYVVSIPELREYLSRRSNETFIDEAEIMEARFMIGDPSIRDQFDQDVRQFVLQNNRDAFLADILHELKDRRKALPIGLNVKRGRGGLREIHLLWIAVAVYAGLPGPFRASDLGQVCQLLPDHRVDFKVLLMARSDLRRVRDLYRLVVAGQEDPMDPDALIRIATDLAPIERAGAREGFADEIRRVMETVAARVDRVAAAIAADLS